MRYSSKLPVLRIRAWLRLSILLGLCLVMCPTGMARSNDAQNPAEKPEVAKAGASDNVIQTSARYSQFVAVGDIVSDPIDLDAGKPGLLSSQFDFKVTEILKGQASTGAKVNVLIFRTKLQDHLEKGSHLILFLNSGKGLKWMQQTAPPDWVSANPCVDAVPASAAMIEGTRKILAAMPEPIPATIQLEQVMRKHLPGYTLRAKAKDSNGPLSGVDILAAPSGQEINLNSTRNEWTGMTLWLPPPDSYLNKIGDDTTHWRNGKLTSLLSSLALKVESASDAEDIGRMVLGLFVGPGVLDTWRVKANQWEHGWVLTPQYVGPIAQVSAQGPIELILEDGVVRDARRREAMFFKENVATVASSSSEPGWGEPVQGLSVRLQSDNSVWYLSQPLALRLSIRNLGKTTFMVPESQEDGELLVDDAWYLLRRPEAFVVIHKTLAPGMQYENIALQPTADWRAGEKHIEPLASKHTLRFAVRARSQAKGNSPAIRVISNPLEVEFRFGVPPRAPESAK